MKVSPIIVILAAFVTNANAQITIKDTNNCLGSTLSTQLQTVIQRYTRDKTPDHIRLFIETTLPTPQATNSDPEPPIILHITFADAQHPPPHQRIYSLTRQDCHHSTELIVLVLQRFFSKLPTDQITERHQASVKTPLQVRIAEFGIHTAINNAWTPFGGDAEFGLSLSLGAQQGHRFIAGFLARASLPRSLARGSVFDLSAFTGLGWEYAGKKWRPSAQLRGGALWVTGLGHDENSNGWVPWVEGVVSIARRWTHLSIALQAAVSPLHHEAYIDSSTASTSLPMYRIGIAVNIPLWQKKF